MLLSALLSDYSSKLLRRKLGAIFGLVVWLYNPTLAQAPTEVFSEKFMSNALPAGWTVTSGGSSYNWGVVAGLNLPLGEPSGSFLHVGETLLKSETNLNVWAFTPPMRLYPDIVYTISFYQRSNSLGPATLKVALSTTPAYTNANAFEAQQVLPANLLWTEQQYAFTVATEGDYYLGYGVTAFSMGLQISLDNIRVTPTSTVSKEFYNKSGADLTALSSWGANPDGSGIAPVSFNGVNQKFNIINYSPQATLTLPRHWNITGVGAKVKLGNGTTPVTLQVSNAGMYLGNALDVADNATLFVDANICPKLGKLSPQSTLIFEANAPAELLEGEVFGSVVLKSGKRNKLTKKIKINGQLDLRGAKLDLSDFDLELGPEAAIINSSASNYVVLGGKGRLRQNIRPGTEVMLPVGNTAYNPVKIKLKLNAQEDVFSVGVVEGVYNTYNHDVPELASPVTGKVVNKTWIISEDVKGGSDISLTLAWNAADALPGFNPENCHIKHYENNVWDADLATTATFSDGTYTVTRTGITSFSPFTVSSENPTVLPVELLQFAVKATGNHTVELSWATATEKNNDYFVVERSHDGKNFTQLARVKGHGTTNTRSDYRFTDNNPLAGTTYYRLRQLDVDGHDKYLPMRSITRKGAPSLSLSVYPNPAQGSPVNLQLQGLPPGEAATLLITDVIGNTRWQKQISATSQVSLAAGELKAGTYLVKVISPTRAQTRKLVIR